MTLPESLWVDMLTIDKPVDWEFVCSKQTLEHSNITFERKKWKLESIPSTHQDKPVDCG